MKFECAAYELQFVRPMQFGEHTLTSRRGWLLLDPLTGAIGEVAPLPGFSRESFDDTEHALLRGGPLVPSVTWALFQMSMARPIDCVVRVAGLVVGDENPPPGFRTLKLKVGRTSHADDCRRVERLRSAGVRLRLDGNRALSMKETTRLVELAGDALEFIEEPVPPADLRAAVDAFPVALDESLLDPPDFAERAAAFICKPMLLGANALADVRKAAISCGIPLVISSSFESAIGLAALAHLGAEVGDGLAHGLGTASFLSRDFEGWTDLRGDELRAGRAFGPAPNLDWRTIELEQHS